jgi:hypothetical protein
MVTYQLSVGWLPPAMAGLVIGALFILPFLLFSATAGQLTDKYDKTVMIRFVKNLEIAIMAIAAWGFVTEQRGRAAVVHLPDGCALHAVWPGQVCAVAAGAQRARADGWQRHGGDGHLCGHFDGQCGGRPAGGHPDIGHETVAIACGAWPWWGVWWRAISPRHRPPTRA